MRLWGIPGQKSEENGRRALPDVRISVLCSNCAKLHDSKVPIGVNGNPPAVTAVAFARASGWRDWMQSIWSRGALKTGQPLSSAAGYFFPARIIRCGLPGVNSAHDNFSAPANHGRL
jgi:hypothetical protein